MYNEERNYMPRIIVPLLNNEIYHVFNRGIDKRDVYIDKSDTLRFYQSLNFFNTVEPTINFDSAKVQIKLHSVQNKLVNIKAYALLPNHFHLIIEQIDEGGISEFMKRVLGGYTSYFNKKYERTGALFQGTFKRVHVNSDKQFNYLFAYVNENHFVHNFAFKREICHTSSLHYQGLAKSSLITDVDRAYNFLDSVALAEQIYKRRSTDKITNLIE